MLNLNKKVNNQYKDIKVNGTILDIIKKITIKKVKIFKVIFKINEK